ncbi:protein phosphatase 2A structural subunit [Ciborinia camelliae]|nr:protein phosphatase 2A structural subunit [Ciborinia camelliae]
MADGPDKTDELYPIAVLIDELKHDDVLLRLNAIHRLSTIALALGAERTRDELIPFLDESVEDEDEVLTALSEELGNFVEYVGGPEFGHVLLSPLENLAAIEEPLVREKAVESLNKICEELSSQQVEEYFIPLTIRLSKADWFTSKISATGLYNVPYKKASPPMQEQLRQQFGLLVHDETPMVRRQSANNLSKFVKEMPATIVVEEMIPLFQHLAGDDQDSVRLLTVEILIAIAEVVPKEQQSSHGVLLTALRSLIEDKSWRVRYMVADRFEKIAKAVDDEVVTRDLVPAFVKLLKDSEAEVRTAIAGQIPGFCKLVDRTTLLNDIMTTVEDLVSDTSQHVRAALGTQISGLAPILGKQEYVLHPYFMIFMLTSYPRTIDHLLPMFLQMLKDEFPDVRLHIISKLELVNQVIGIDLLSQSLLPAIVQLAEDKQWRVRLAIIEYIPLLASQLGVQFFDEKLAALCMGWLGDTVFSIRDAATKNLKKLTEVFGVDWANEAIIPKVMAMGAHPNYLYRMTTCFAITTLAQVVSLDVVSKSILPMMDKLVADEIPNIRFNVAKSYSEIISVLKRLPDEGTVYSLEKSGSSEPPSARGQELIQERILPNLEKLQKDDDVDVRFFATTAAASISYIDKINSWDNLYNLEISNHAQDATDVGTIWFDDSSAEDKVVDFLNGEVIKGDLLGLGEGRKRADLSLLDLGTGNGHFLFRLREGEEVDSEEEEDEDEDEGKGNGDEGNKWVGRMMGADYSEKSIEFARQIAEDKREEREREDEETNEEMGNDIEFITWDIMKEDPSPKVLNGKQAKGWDIVLDKGTFDAISLSEETDANGKRIFEGYREKVLSLVRVGGVAVVTSCNWTEEELIEWFVGKGEEDERERFEVLRKIEYRSFSFGGVKGQTVCSVCFRKCGGNE